ncbi:MAG: HNH endonuclease [Cyanobacteria bacterium J06598_1]
MAPKISYALSPHTATCQLCARNCPKLTEHHLIPRQETKRKKRTRNKYNHPDLGPTIDICPPCHKQVHTLFTNKELAADLNSAELLKSHPAMDKFLKWVAKQDPYKKVRTRK